MNDIAEKLQDVFREVFDDPRITIHREMVAHDLKDWDSFNHVRLIVGVEECFGVNFSTDEVADLRNVGELIDLIGFHLNGERKAV
jgi:acyl carrier protein